MTAPPEPRAPAAPHPGPPGAAEARLAAAGDGWRRKLLDLTKRNRALNFRPARVSTVTVVDERPAEVFRQLFLRERSMRFTPAPPRGAAGQSPEAEGDADAGDGGVDETLPEALDFVPYDRASLGERHTDEWLQTASTPDALDRSLRRLDEQARLAIEEQGVNTLFLALGMLHYAESDDAAHALRAPLVLLPVELSRRSARAGYTVRATDDDPVVNPALAELLRRAHGVALPELPEPGAMAEEYDLQTWLAAAADAVAGRAGWARHDGRGAGALQLPEARDVQGPGGERRGAGGAPAGAAARPARRHRPRDRAPRRRARHGARRRVPARAHLPGGGRRLDPAARGRRRGARHDLVIEGPPGTGKSQTITNVIAQALAADKSVLFVAEKMAALSVVHARPRGRGARRVSASSSTPPRRTSAPSCRRSAAALDASLQGWGRAHRVDGAAAEVRAALTDLRARALQRAVRRARRLADSGYGEYGA
jgi:hypothetical protein